MPRQNRRTVSFKAETFYRLQELARALNSSPTKMADDAINALCEQHRIPSVSREEAVERLGEQSRARTRPPKDEIISQHFTF